MKKIAIYGGTFNPIHLGHTSLVKAIDLVENFDKILFIPTATPPHKSSDELAYAKARIDMINLALQNSSKYEISDIEITRGGKSYTYDTVVQLQEQYKNTEIYFICGQDMFFTVENWYNSKDLIKILKFCVAPRSKNIYNENNTLLYLKNSGVDFTIYDIEFFDISSSKIRDNVAKNKSIKGLVTTEVENYIHANYLYRGV